jgi:hypothetical protein
MLSPQKLSICFNNLIFAKLQLKNLKQTQIKQQHNEIHLLHHQWPPIWKSARDIEMINNSEADWFHIDHHGWCFVPNISYGMPVLEAINKHAKKTIDVHLMIVDPDRYIKTLLN